LADYRLGLHLLTNGKGADAIEELRTAAKLDPKHVDVRSRLARLLAGQNDSKPGEAEGLLIQVIALDPGHADAHFYLGRMLANAGRKAELGYSNKWRGTRANLWPEVW